MFLSIWANSLNLPYHASAFHPVSAHLLFISTIPPCPTKLPVASKSRGISVFQSSTTFCVASFFIYFPILRNFAAVRRWGGMSWRSLSALVEQRRSAILLRRVSQLQRCCRQSPQPHSSLTFFGYGCNLMAVGIVYILIRHTLKIQAFRD